MCNMKDVASSDKPTENITVPLLSVKCFNVFQLIILVLLPSAVYVQFHDSYQLCF